MKSFKNLLGTINYSVITIIILVLVLFPIPVLFIDFIVLLNLFFSFLLMLDVYFGKKKDDYSFFPGLLIVFTIVNMSVNIVITRQILTLGEDFNDIVIRYAALPLTGLNSDLLMAVLTVLFLIAAVYLFFAGKTINRIENLASRFTQDVRLERIAEIETEYYSRVITEKEVADRKDSLGREFEYFDLLEDSIRLFSLYEKFRLVFIIMNSAGGYLIGTRIRNEITNDAFINYISLATAGGFLSLVSGVFLTLAINVFYSRIKSFL